MRARRSRVRRAAKWAGLVVCIAVTTAACASGWWAVGYRGGDVWFVDIAAGRAVFSRGHLVEPLEDGWFAVFGEPEWLWEFEYLPGMDLIIPLWFVLLVLAAPTVFLWHRDRRFRFPPGHCAQCGYDLYGLTEPRCPECGTGFGGEGGT